MRRLRSHIFLVAIYLLVTNPGYSQGTPAVLHCSFNGHLDVHSRSERSSPVIAKIKCGDRLFVIEQRFLYPYVRTEGGKDGFILSPNHGEWSIDPAAGPPKDSAATPVATSATFVAPGQTPDSIESSAQPGTTVGTKVGTTVGTTAAIALAAPAGSAVGTTASGTAVGTVAGASTRTGEQLSIGPNRVAKSEESAGTKTVSEPLSVAASDSTASSERPGTAESAGPTSGQPAVLTNSDIVYLVKAHLSAELITALIQSSRPNFETTPAALADLKAANVPDAIVLAMRQMSGSKFPQ